MDKNASNQFLMEQACRWSLYFISQMKTPYFSKPGIRFGLMKEAVPLVTNDLHVSRKHLVEPLGFPWPEVELRGASGAVIADVLTVMLDEHGNIHGDPIGIPRCLLVKVALKESEDVLRRVVSVSECGKLAKTIPDRILSFDLRQMLLKWSHHSEIIAQPYGAGGLH